MASETVGGLTLTVTLRGYVTGNDGVRMLVDKSYEMTFSDGTGNNQVQWLWQDDGRPLNATNETLDLDGLTDFKGAVMSDNTSVKVIWAEHKSTTAAEVMKLGGGDFAAADGPVADATDKIATGPRGLILLVNPLDGWGITATTKDGLRMELTGNSTYDLVMAGDNT